MRWLKLVFWNLLLFALLFVVGGELTLRWLARDKFYQHFDERNLTYRYDPVLGWFPREDSRNVFMGSRRVQVRHNHLGFRDQELGPKTKPRIAFLGDSFVWGYDLEEHERFTEQLQARLPDWEIVNLGVSGYGTDQELLLLKRYFARVQPDIVFLMYCGNDPIDNSSNQIVSGNYFKPYFTAESGQLTLGGVPVPKSANFYLGKYPWLAVHSVLFKAVVDVAIHRSEPAAIQVPDPTLLLIRDLKNYVESQGAAFALGLTHYRKEVIEYAERKGIPAVLVENSYVYPEMGQHWTPRGSQYVAERLFGFLQGYSSSTRRL
jgi:hypothetical protein